MISTDAELTFVVVLAESRPQHRATADVHQIKHNFVLKTLAGDMHSFGEGLAFKRLSVPKLFMKIFQAVRILFFRNTFICKQKVFSK